MKVFAVPARETNLMYVVLGDEGTLLLVDPVDMNKIRDFLKDNKIQHSRVASLTTHGHSDHNAGNKELLEAFPNAEIFAGSDRSFANRICSDGDVVCFPDIYIICMHTPCHTLDSYSYYVSTSRGESKSIFVGDTLFYSGCGKFFEGTAEMMQACFRKIFSSPPDTLIYFGHDYKKTNLRFRESILGSALEQEDNVFSVINSEKQNNIFVNTGLLDNHRDFASLSPVERLNLLRQMKDRFV